MKTIINFFKHMSLVHETENQLNSMSNRELWDIGITRADIKRVARGELA